jgi:hypothetical protein
MKQNWWQFQSGDDFVASHLNEMANVDEKGSICVCQ